MSAALIPESQFDALPCISAAQYVAEAGDVEIVRGQITRYFSPEATGINAWAGNVGDPWLPGSWMCYSNRMNCLGCSRFTFMLCTKMREKSHDTSMTILVYARAWVAAEPGVMVAPDPKLWPSAWSQVGRFRLSISDPLHVDPILPPGDPNWPIWYKSGSASWDVGAIVPGTSTQGGLTGGMALRLRAANGAGVDKSGFNAELYGSLIAAS